MSSYYYAQNKQRQGPVSGARLKELAAAGQLARKDQICREGETKWVLAGQVKGLFAEEPEAVAVEEEATPAEPHTPPRSEKGPRFHYRQNGQQAGPVSRAALKDLAASGRLLPQDFVWQEGTKNWVPAAHVDGLFAGRRCQVNGVSLLHPRDWTVTVKNAGVRQIFWISVENDTLLMDVSFLPTKITSPEDWMQSIRDSLQKNPDTKELRFVRVESALAGEMAHGFDYKCITKSYPLGGRAVAARIGSHTVTMFWQAVQEDLPTIQSVADLVRASITIEEGEDRSPQFERSFAGGVRGAVGGGVAQAMAAYKKGQ
jgi:hypothetical protein